MTQDPLYAASMPNPGLARFGILIGRWTILGTHPLMPGVLLHGQATFEWIENGAFLQMRSEIAEPGVPTALALIGSDDATDECAVLYFDERGVARNLRTTLQDKVWRMWRAAPGFDQRFTGTLAEDGSTIVGKWELARTPGAWDSDLELTYTRAG